MPQSLDQLLTPPKTVAVVGLSDKPERPSNQVASYLQDQGFTIIPVNPMIQTWRGITAYPSVTAIPHDTHIDIVDIFRRSEEVTAIVQQVIDSGRRPFIWMQEGVISEDAKALAEAYGLEVLMDACMMKKHRAMR